MTEARVRAHTRADGTKVKAHSRNLAAWKKAGGAWVGAGASGVTCAGIIVQFGFTTISGIFIVLTALMTLILGGVAKSLTKKARGGSRRRKAPRRSRLITVSVPASPKRKPPAKRKTTAKKRRR